MKQTKYNGDILILLGVHGVEYLIELVLLVDEALVLIRVVDEGLLVRRLLARAVELQLTFVLLQELVQLLDADLTAGGLLLEFGHLRIQEVDLLRYGFAVGVIDFIHLLAQGLVLLLQAIEVALDVGLHILHVYVHLHFIGFLFYLYWL
jgi:hypothetical protein